jgi:hypothetical protein
MAVHDGAPWVADAVRSVLGQTAGDLELIVIDAGSTDAKPGIPERIGPSRMLRVSAEGGALPERLGRQRFCRRAHGGVAALRGRARGRRGWRGLVEEMALIMAKNILVSRRYTNCANVKNDEGA